MKNPFLVYYINYHKMIIMIIKAAAYKGACTGKSLSEALIFAEHGENMLCKVLSWEVSRIELVIVG